MLIQGSAILQAAIHHADDKVKLLMIQNCPVLLYVQVKLMGKAATGSSPLQGPEYSRKQLLCLKHFPFKHIGDAIPYYLQATCTVDMRPTTALQYGR